MHPDLFNQISVAMFQHLGQPAKFIPKQPEHSEPLTIQVIAQPLQEYHHLADQGISLEQGQFSILAAEVKKPRIGDVIEFKQKRYEISQTPGSDPYHLVWGIIATCYA